VVRDSKSLFKPILNIWGEPAENFAMLTNRGHEIFVEASLRQEK
jgi:single-stranded DNA-binding protein